MDFNKFQTNVEAYTDVVKDKFLSVNGATIALHNKISDNVTDISTLKSDVARIDGELTALDSSFEQFANGYLFDYNVVVSDISTLKVDVSTLLAKSDAIDAGVVSLVTDVSALKNVKVVEIDSSISSLKAKDTALDSSVKALISADSQINSSISGIKATIGSATDASTMTTIFGMLAALRSDFEDYELVTATALTDISARLDAANIA